mmetsp:Transcript_110623/g.174308  ORF Transcript_110623/g.174308 Transcript_110623/m.174308 type:complete len:410 (+) Transcript_110623:572-1801(+)
MDVFKFRKWLRTPAGRPFEEKGKGYDDGCYLTSGVLRLFMPRGYTTFVFENSAGESATVVMRGFMKFTGLSATDEDEESAATSEVDAFMFHGFTRGDASRFAVTTKSNGENGKYTMRKIFGEWYCFAGSKNTGMVWKMACDATKLYPVPTDNAHGGANQVGPKIIGVVHGLLGSMPESNRTELLKAVDVENYTIMIELNDPDHEHIFPIDEIWADHVAILSKSGYPLPQRDAYAFFARFGLRHVKCDVYDDISKLESVMEEIRASTDTEGAVIYLERDDDTPVGLVKVKSDHYVIARRTRETVRGTLINKVSNGENVDEALQEAKKRLRKGMAELHHIAGCKEHHEEWSTFAVAFATSWATAYKKANQDRRRSLIREFQEKYGTLYKNFWEDRKSGKTDIVPSIEQRKT